MLSILKNIKKYWKSVIMIIVLLSVQAVCDLSLPDFTSKLIDTGIQNNGIEYAVPEAIGAESYALIGAFMNEEEALLWQSSYVQGDDGIYYLTDTSEKNIKKLDGKFTTPIAIAKMIRQSASGMQQTFPQMQQTDPTQLRTVLDEKLAAVGETMLKTTAISYIAEEYDRLSIDLSSLRTQYLWKTGIKMLLLSLLMTVAAIGVGLLASRVGAGVGRDLREKVFSNVLGFSNAEMNKFSTASLITRCTNDIQQVQMVTVMILRMVLFAPIIAAGAIILVFRTGADMEWIIFVAVLAILGIVISLMSVAMPKFKKMQLLVDRVNLVAREILTGIPVIRAFSRERTEENRFDQANRELTGVMLFTNRVMTFMMPLMTIVMNGVSLLIVWVAAGRIDQGVLEVGEMTAFITYTMMIVTSFLMITMISIVLPRAAVASERINEVINTVSVISDAEDAQDISDCTGKIAFNNVSFKYSSADDNALENITFTAEPGETTAVIGSTGCGKTTLVQLILRFFDVTDGSITIDGKDIRNVTQKSLRDIVGYVPQKSVLFSGTIDSNLRYGAQDAKADDIRRAAEIAQASEFIEEKPDAFESAIAQGGTNVSGGQKQRLSIARAIAKNPKIYIFDDSFSALDFKTDAALRKALSEITQDSTVIIVAQRISTIMNAEKILVLEDGRLAGIGTHRELMKNCPVYSQIAYSQLSEKEIEESMKGDDK